MEEFHAYYDILNDVRVVFPENLDDLRSTLSSSYGEIFFTWEQFRVRLQLSLPFYSEVIFAPY